MKSSIRIFATIAVLAVQWAGPARTVGAPMTLPAGGEVRVSCMDTGLEMRNGKTVKSCLLAGPAELRTSKGLSVFCAERFSASFQPNGALEYCTLSRDMAIPRAGQDMISCRAGGRVAFYPDGKLEFGVLRDTAQLAFKEGSAVICRGGYQATFRRDGNLATCILDQESTVLNGLRRKATSTCQSGGLIAFDEAGALSGCYSPPGGDLLPKENASRGTATQGGQNK